MTTFCYPYERGTGYRSQGFRSGKGSPYNAPGGHTGFDQAMPVGTRIYSPGDGIVRNSDWLRGNYLANPWWLTAMGGDTLVIDCTDAFGNSDTMPTFIIAHLQESIPAVGQRVRKGELVGISGNSGTATTGPHAHIEALPPRWDVNNGVYGRVDPELYFTEWPEDIVPGLAAAGEISRPTDKETEVPKYKRVTAPDVERRLAKGKAMTLVTDATNRETLNLAVLGLGHYDVDLFLRGRALPVGEVLTVRYRIVPTGGKPSEYFEEDVPGTTSGKFRGRVRFKMPITKPARLEVSVVSSKESAYLEGFSAEVYAWAP